MHVGWMNGEGKKHGETDDRMCRLICVVLFPLFCLFALSRVMNVYFCLSYVL